jgi:hypothetical protein
MNIYPLLGGGGSGGHQGGAVVGAGGSGGHQGGAVIGAGGIIEGE